MTDATHGPPDPVFVPAPPAAEPAPGVRLYTHNDILDLLVQDASLSDILQVLTAMVEREITGARASILLLDETGARMRVAAGPTLPAEFKAAIDGLLIGSGVGSCGTAVYENRVVITPDIAHDPAWDQWRPAAEAAGLAACWSTPFLGLHDRVLGTFAVYFAEPREPTPTELALLHDAGYLAAVAVQHDAVQRRLRDTSRTHPITGLPNRLALTERLRAVEDEMSGTDRRFALLQIAVGGIAGINESLGPNAGDAVLRAAATRLVALVDEASTAAHAWGSDFLVLAPDLDTAAAEALAERIVDALLEPFPVDGMTLVVGVAIGLVVCGTEVLSDPRPLDEPLRAAGVALERAKLAGERQIAVYDAYYDPQADVRLLAPALRRGIDDEELHLAYQPVVRLVDERVDHYEALLRWTTRHGTVPPHSFVPVAERTGLVGDLGRYALQRALAALAAERATGREFGMAVNLSVRQLSDRSLPDVVAAMLAEYQLPPDVLTLEVTEGVLLTARAEGWGTLDRIRDTGVRISLDDFGTGYSQIGYLRRFRFDEIKIDRSFVEDIDDLAARAIVIGTISFAAAAGITVVAEGIESRHQADRLIELGCTHGQGYLFGAARSTLSPT